VTASWEPRRYLRFERERMRPCYDLLAQIPEAPVHEIVDLGCGPGTSTAALRARWPEARCTGVDTSPEMLEVARRSDPSVRWVVGDIRTWVPDVAPDLIFSNAALQWVPDHAALVPRLFRRLGKSGTLAFQVPVGGNPPYLEIARRLQRSAPWAELGRSASGGNTAEAASVYLDALADLARRVEAWDTQYYHLLPGPEAIVDWLRGAALREWLASLPDEPARGRFLSAYLDEIRRAYPSRPDGTVVFPFLRRFVVAGR
jgi:trans-aconitate 2-methyltransferase